MKANVQGGLFAVCFDPSADAPLPPEPPQMVIPMPIAPAHPVSLGHHAEHGMRLPFEVPRLAREAIE